MHVNSCTCVFCFPRDNLKYRFCTSKTNKITDLCHQRVCSQGETIEKISSSQLNIAILNKKALFHILQRNYQAKSIIGPCKRIHFHSPRPKTDFFKNFEKRQARLYYQPLFVKRARAPSPNWKTGRKSSQAKRAYTKSGKNCAQK